MGVARAAMNPFRQNAFPAVATLLLGASLYFTVRVSALKRSVETTPGVSVPSGAEVTLTAVLDGDEVSVRYGASHVHVRLLGVYAFDPTTNDPVEQPFGRAAVSYLETLREQPVTLEFDEAKVDSQKRLLAYLRKDGADLGEGMVQRGLALAYTKYAFLRSSAYVLAEEQAIRGTAGLWADGRVVERAKRLRSLWEQERRGLE